MRAASVRGNVGQVHSRVYGKTFDYAAIGQLKASHEHLQSSYASGESVLAAA